MSQKELPAVEFSVVVPVFNELANLDPLVERVRATLDGLALSWELVTGGRRVERRLGRPLDGRPPPSPH